MSNKYKTTGVLGISVRLRTGRTWIITFSNGEETKFKSQRLAIMGSQGCFKYGNRYKAGGRDAVALQQVRQG